MVSWSAPRIRAAEGRLPWLFDGDPRRRSRPGEPALSPGPARLEQGADKTRAGSPAFFLYLVALALLPWQSFPGFPWLHDNAQWSDPFAAAAAVAWLLESRRRLASVRIGLAELALGGYVVAALASYLASSGAFGGGAANLAGVAELAVLALLTADFASRPGAFRVIVWVVTATSLLAAAAAMLGLALFYAGVDTSLVGSYGALEASSDYARVQAGMTHPALLGSYCIFASAVIARGDGVISRRLRWTAQAALAITVLATVSRAILGFGLAALIRADLGRVWGRLAIAATVACLALMALLTFTKVLLDPSDPLGVRIASGAESVRSQELRAAVDTLADHPLLGTGPGSLPGEAPGYGRRQAHDTPVGIAATLGLPALLFLVGLLVALWLARTRPTDRAVWGGLAGLGVDGLGQDTENFRHVWVMLGLAGARLAPEAGSGRAAEGVSRPPAAAPPGAC